MMNSVESLLGNIEVITTSGRGQTVEEVAERALNRVVYVGANAHPAIRDQAEAFKDSIREVLISYMHEAVRADRVTLANKFRNAGHEQFIPLLDI
tara:strand:+ start:13315 stop:13599 length:285 start_codon:yes stop_codon:yes gene_type:complete